ncbi:hypothetical protein DXC69_05245 [Paenibacillus polymyxa]|uniref:hypothetical protein n=1 Tax=Paenibacillus polymyxa TaxID=1406 RepID=UPI0004DEEA02|nr:hypothetical protein [Paenibacillus polymyxa]MBY7739489.1 hypothetical protein [Paenibacillus polymyxa]RGL38733.1 hypothetical protein DXC69_05245 [Paenibacillus polymyxa]UMR34391.1 hypothetical protein MJ749_17085 [Paenibacillus polymyxa]
MPYLNKEHYQRKTIERQNYNSAELVDQLEKALQTFVYENLKISHKAIARYLKIPFSALGVNGLGNRISKAIRKQNHNKKKLKEKYLWSLANEYIKTHDHEQITLRDVVTFLGMSYSNIITNYNGLNNKITSKIEETKEKLRQERINKYKADVDFVISDLLQKAGRITVCTVLEYTGVSYHTLYKSMPEVLLYIRKEKDRLNFNKIPKCCTNLFNSHSSHWQKKRVVP